MLPRVDPKFHHGKVTAATEGIYSMVTEFQAEIPRCQSQCQELGWMVRNVTWWAFHSDLAVAYCRETSMKKPSRIADINKTSTQKSQA